MQYTYVLFSAFLNKYYIGYSTNHLILSLLKHLQNKTGFTAKSNDWVIVYFEECKIKIDAMAKERNIKAWKSSVRIKVLINKKST